MKLKLGIFLAGLIVMAIGIGICVDSASTVQIPVYKSPRHQQLQIVDTYITVTKNPSGVGLGAAIAVVGLGAGIGIPVILGRRKNTPPSSTTS